MQSVRNSLQKIVQKFYRFFQFHGWWIRYSFMLVPESVAYAKNLQLILRLYPCQHVIVISAWVDVIPRGSDGRMSMRYTKKLNSIPGFFSAPGNFFTELAIHWEKKSTFSSNEFLNRNYRFPSYANNLNN